MIIGSYVQQQQQVETIFLSATVFAIVQSGEKKAKVNCNKHNFSISWNVVWLLRSFLHFKLFRSVKFTATFCSEITPNRVCSARKVDGAATQDEIELWQFGTPRVFIDKTPRTIVVTPRNVAYFPDRRQFTSQFRRTRHSHVLIFVTSTWWARRDDKKKNARSDADNKQNFYYYCGNQLRDRFKLVKQFMAIRKDLFSQLRQGQELDWNCA